MIMIVVCGGWKNHPGRGVGIDRASNRAAVFYIETVKNIMLSQLIVLISTLRCCKTFSGAYRFRNNESLA